MTGAEIAVDGGHLVSSLREHRPDRGVFDKKAG
jgi:hypothetical protein